MPNPFLSFPQQYPAHVARHHAAGEGSMGRCAGILAFHKSLVKSHEWEALPEKWTALLPGKLQGRLYLYRPDAGETDRIGHESTGKGDSIIGYLKIRNT